MGGANASGAGDACPSASEMADAIGDAQIEGPRGLKEGENTARLYEGVLTGEEYGSRDTVRASTVVVAGSETGAEVLTSIRQNGGAFNAGDEAAVSSLRGVMRVDGRYHQTGYTGVSSRSDTSKIRAVPTAIAAKLD